jgi:hypothetical protein
VHVLSHALPLLFDRILIRKVVREQLGSAAAPDAIKQFLKMGTIGSIRAGVGFA